jgi:DNA invertase Pin-like site-specific DNA recombinase
MTYIEETAAYTRVSHTEQKLHGLSLAAQEQKLTEYAEKHNLKIVEWYKDEGVSGRKPIAKRPELQRMIHDAQKGKFRRIIFIKLDRFFRSLAEYHECMKMIDPVIWTATEEKYDLSTANGRAFVNMKLTIAELEADQTGERIKLVNEYKIKSGLPLFGTQSLPFCYAVSEPKKGERHKYIEKVDEEIMEDLIAHVMVNHSIRSATFYINNKYRRSFSYGAITRTLKNEMICGSYKGNPNYCKPYITREMFDRLQEIIKRNPRTSENEYAYVFTGLMRCPNCGRKLCGASQQVRARGKLYYYRIYRCPKQRQDRQCSFSFSLTEGRLEEQMLERLEQIIEKQEIRNIEIQNQENKVSKHNVTELQEELDRLNYSWQKGRIKDVEEYDRKYDKLVAKIDAANAETVELSQVPDFERIKSTLVAGWKEIYKELDNEHKRAFWRSFIQEIHIDWSKRRKEVADIDFF